MDHLLKLSESVCCQMLLVNHPAGVMETANLATTNLSTTLATTEAQLLAQSQSGGGVLGAPCTEAQHMTSLSIEIPSQVCSVTKPI